jgi:hypothetical protein
MRVGGADPLARWGPNGAFPDQGDKARYVGDPGDRYAENVPGCQYEVVVRVNECGQDNKSRVIDYERGRSAPGGEQVAAAVRPVRRGDLATADGEDIDCRERPWPF